MAMLPHVRSVLRMGGIPVVLPVLDPAAAADTLDHLDGLVLTGGNDVHPDHYGAALHEHTTPDDPARDLYELQLSREAVARDLPTLAVCRGMQVLNVATGGALAQHRDGHMVVDRWNEEVHSVRVEDGCALHRLWGDANVGVNSLHHQAVDTTGPGVRAIAWADDGTVEAIAVDRAPSVLGVQWHPELVRHLPAHRALWSWLIERSGEKRMARDGVEELT
jgi:gamma-glutamyl-gamma-aminobutyrate hydrolase PuuD